MNQTIAIFPATAEHVRALGHSLREGDRREVESLGCVPHRILWRSFKQAAYARTAIIGTEVAAMWGVGGSLVGLHGRPWLLTAPIVETVKLSFLKIACRELSVMRSIFPHLENIVAADYSGAVRLLQTLGFTIDEPVPYKSTGAMFRRFHMTEGPSLGN